MIPYFCSFVVAALESVITDILHQATFVVVPIDEVLLLSRGCVRPWEIQQCGFVVLYCYRRRFFGFGTNTDTVAEGS